MTYLVTGAYGFIGSWVVRRLLDDGERVVTFDAGDRDHRLRYLLEPDELADLRRIAGDIADLGAVRSAVAEHEVDHVIHLAALQIPFCAADPPLGALVNVVGTVNVFEAVRGTPAEAHPVVFASSVAAYEEGSGGGAGDAHRGLPSTHYGVYKRANEGNAWVFHADHGVRSIGLRPYVAYGVGRDQGLTSAPTEAMRLAAQGRGAHIAYGGRSHLQLGADVAAAFVAAARSPYEGAAVANLRGAVVEMRDLVAAIEAAAPAVAGRVTFDDTPLPFPPELDADGLDEVVGPVPETPLADGVRDTVQRFRDLLERGLLAPEP